MLGFSFSLCSGSSAILSSRRSDESCLSKDQRKIPLTSSIEVNQTSELEGLGRKGSRIRL